MNIGNFALKALELALIADQEYAAVTASPIGATATLLQPNNFQTLTMELAQVFAATPPVPATVNTPVSVVVKPATS